MQLRLALLLTMVCAPVCAQSKPVARDRLVVDVVTLKTGRTLRGAVIGKDAQGTLSMAVSRAWFSKANPASFEEASVASQVAARTAWTETIERLRPLLDPPPKSEKLAFFYRQELERLEELIAREKSPETEFLLLQLPSASLSKVVMAAPERRRLALLAWQEQLPGVETTDAANLQRSLEQEKIPLDGPLPDLSDRLSSQPQSDQEWTARLALVEYALHQPIDFQGMGSTLVQTGTDQPLDLASVLPKLMEEQVGSVLNDLLGNQKSTPTAQDEQAALRPAIKAAEKVAAKGFRVTRLALNTETRRAVVETRFVVNLSPKVWRTVWFTVQEADGSVARPALEEQITADPQVKSALKSIQALGLGADDALSQAIRMGAATMTAQQAADAQFFELRDRYTRRLDGPPLPVGD